MSPPRKKSEITRDRRNIARLYLRGKLQTEIAAELGISQPTVSRDLKVIQKSWRKSTIIDFNERIAQELAKIDTLEREYWDEWERSQDPQLTERAEKGEGPKGPNKKAVRKTVERTGDPRYLQGVQWCINKRCELLGLDAPKQIEAFGKDGQPLFDAAAAVQALQEASRMLDADDDADID